MTTADIRAADGTWTASKIRTLVEGEATVVVTDATGREYEERREGPTAYELRCRALDTGNVELMHDVIQLDMAVETIRDDGVFVAMVDTTVFGTDVDELEDVTGRGRAGRHLLDRGVELVRRHERGRRSERVRLGRDGDEPVCFRCMTRRVSTPGDLCSEECDGLTRSQRRRHANLRRGPVPANTPYDPTERPDPAMMSQAEIEAEIAHLAETQGSSVIYPGPKREAPIPGGHEYASRVHPYGLEIPSSLDIK